jgi:hypothetical protein
MVRARTRLCGLGLCLAPEAQELNNARKAAGMVGGFEAPPGLASQVKELLDRIDELKGVEARLQATIRVRDEEIVRLKRLVVSERNSSYPSESID